MPTPSDLIADPQWFPAAIDVDRDLIAFVQTSRDKLSDEAFLDARAFPDQSAFQTARLSDLVSQLPAPPTKPGFIFHSAFCCSTLLARALDGPGKTLTLKEPKILEDFANAVRVSARFKKSPAEAIIVFNFVTSLLARPFHDSEKVIIKPTNAANNLAALAFKENMPILFLYGSLRNFLISILKKGEEGRAFARQLYNIFVLDPGGLSQFPARQAMSFTDLQAAALVWRCQLEIFATVLAQHSDRRSAALDFEKLLADPAPILNAAAAHFSLSQNSAELNAAAESDIFKKNSKFTDSTFDAQTRKSEASDIENIFGDNLTLIENWASSVRLDCDVHLPLSPQLAT